MNETVEENDDMEYAGLTKSMIVAGAVHLLVDVALVFVLWNLALVGSVDGVHPINPLVAAGLVFLARSISRG